MRVPSFQPPVRTLMGPGPSDIHPRVLAAMSRPTIGHLDPEFIRMMDQIKAMLQQAFRTSNELTMVVSGPGTVGMESCVVNLLEPGDEAVVCVNGVFGGRLAEMIRRCGGEPIIVEQEWGRAIDPEAVRGVLRQHPGAKALAFVHAETSTGALSDAPALAGLAREHGCLTIADAVTSLGGAELQVDGWGLDAVYSGSQKCLSCTPGLSPLTFSERAAQLVRERSTPVQSWFMDLGLVMKYWGGGGRLGQAPASGKRAYHHTAPVNALYAMHEALVMLHEEGLEQAWERHGRQHGLLAAGLQDLGVEFLVPASERIPHLNAVRIPSGVDDAAVRARLLQEYGLEIGAGLGPLAGKVWRIGLMGYSARPQNVALCLSALRTVLNR